MKILWFTHRDFEHPNAGGVGKTILEVGKRLSDLGHEVNIISVSWRGKTEDLTKFGMRLVRMKSNIYAHLSAPTIIKTIHSDVIINDLGHAVPWLTEYYTKTPGTVFFHHLHRRSLVGQVSFPTRLVITSLEALYPVIYRKWPFITESLTSYNDLISLGVNRERIRRIEPGVDKTLFHPTLKTEDPSIIYFGGFRDYKRPWEIIYVLKDLISEFPNLKLFMIGDGPSLSKTIKIAKSLNIERKVTFCGNVSLEELSKFVSCSWINVHTSIAEGLGFSILEASCAGTPTVAYSVPGVWDAIQNNLNGILVSDADRCQLKNVIANMIKSYPENWLDNTKRFSKDFSWDKTAKKWEIHLESIIH